MQPRAGPPFRAEHIGSLLRPKSLSTAWRQLGAGEIAPSEFEAVVDDAIRAAVARQEEAGLRSITDGEFRHASYWSHFVEAIEGFGVRPAAYHFHDPDGHDHEFLSPFASGKIRRTRAISGDAFEFLQSATRETPKVTMPSPATMHFWRATNAFSPAAYDDVEAFFADLVTIYQEEIRDLASRGARYVQIDEVPLAMLCDPAVRSRIEAQGGDADAWAERYVGLINECIAGAPSEVSLGLHLCRGNYKGRWLSEGGYDRVAEMLFCECNVHALFLEFDTSRAGGFEPLRFLPADKIAVLGLVTTKSPTLEDANDLKRRIDAASAYAALENLCLSPQCGFSSTVASNPLTIEEERRKLDLIVAVATEMWGSA